MKRSIAQSFAAFAVSCVLFFPHAASAFVTERDWQWVQSVGGMKLGVPQEKDGNWTLPVEIDVTGIRAVTVKPTIMNSGLVCAGIQAEIHEEKIYLALFTSYPWVGGAGGGCPPIVLGHLAPGTYTLFYNGLQEEPLKLTDITLPPK